MREYISEDESIKLYNGDCLEVMDKLIEAGIKVDCIIVDPPYKTNETSGSKTSSSKQDKWQGNIQAGDKTVGISNDLSFDDWMSMINKVLNDNCHVYIYTNDKQLNNMINSALRYGFLLHNILVWKKNNCTPNRWYMKNCEFVLFLRKGKSFPIKNLGSSQFIEVKNINGKEKSHPTEKPVEVNELFIKNSTNEGDLVLDFTMGSGSTGVACKNLNRRFIGIELDEKYFDIAVDRLSK